MAMPPDLPLTLVRDKMSDEDPTRRQLVDLPIDVVHEILANLPAKADRLNVIKSCRALYSVGIRHLYECCSNLRDDPLQPPHTIPQSWPQTFRQTFPQTFVAACSPWFLLRTLLKSPELGEFIKELHWESPHHPILGCREAQASGLFRNMIPIDGRNDTGPSRNEWALLLESIRQMGIQLDQYLLNGVQSAHHLALFLILLRTPKLRVLRLLGNWEHRSVWADVLFRNDNPLSFNSLPFDHLPALHTYVDHGQYANRIPDIHQIMSRPQTQSVTFNLNGRKPILGSPQTLKPNSYDIEDLTIMFDVSKTDSYVWQPGNLINACKGLKSLTFDNISRSMAMQMRRVPSGLEKLLRDHKDTLESFVINHTTQLNERDEIIASVVPMSFAPFENLTNLTIFFEVLITPHTEINHADMNVRPIVSRLPRSLTRLSLIAMKHPIPVYLSFFMQYKVPNLSPRIRQETARLRDFSIVLHIPDVMTIAPHCSTVRQILNRISSHGNFNFEVLGDFYGETSSAFKGIGFGENEQAIRDGIRIVTEAGGKAMISISPLPEWYVPGPMTSKCM